METTEYYAMIAANQAKAEACKAAKCSYSNYSYSRISPPPFWEWTTKLWKGVELPALVCPGCGKPVFVRKHPNSGNEYMIIPKHNKQVTTK